MIVTHQVLMTCTDAAACSDIFLDRLGHGPNLRLRSRFDGDEVNGGLTIVHHQPPGLHDIVVEIYDADEDPIPPSAGVHGRTSKLRRPASRPSVATIRSRLNTPAPGETP